MSDAFEVRQLPNGLVLIGQPMPHVNSAAMSLLLPAGASRDAADQSGAASVLSEWLLRGAGDRDSRALNDALDDLGCQHNESARSEHLSLSAAQLGRNLEAVLGIYADILLRPRLDEATFDPCRQLVLQDLESLEDEPAQKCNLLLREKFFPWPLGRLAYGTTESLANLSAAALRDHARTHLTPKGAILAVAGNIEFDRVAGLVEDLLGDWQGDAPPEPDLIPPVGGATQITKESAQTQLTLAHRAALLRDEQHYYPGRIAEAILSRGMGSRLFTEVREKRGLVYHVSTFYVSLKDHAGMFTYAGTRPEVAEQTLDVTIGELRRLREGIEPDELDRAKTQIRSSLVMQGQSTTSRASALAGDWYHLGALRTLEEINDRVQAVTAQDVIDYLDAYPPEDFTVLTIGPKELDLTAAGLSKADQ